MTMCNDADLNEEIGLAISDGIHHAHFACCIELQRAHVQKLEELRDRLESLRYHWISESNESNANKSFRAQMLASGTRNFLNMWVRLKEDEHSEAWVCLVDAQCDFEMAQRIAYHSAIEDVCVHLLAVEETVFPPQTFLSSAYKYPQAFCTICGQIYGECDHIRGQIYMGQICRRRIPALQVSEVSIVFAPRDKRCRIAELSENGKVYCTLTHREIRRSTQIDPTIKSVAGVVHYFD